MNAGKEKDWVARAIVLVAVVWIDVSFIYTVHQGQAIVEQARACQNAMLLQANALPPDPSAWNLQEPDDAAIHTQDAGLTDEQKDYYRLVSARSSNAHEGSKIRHADK